MMPSSMIYLNDFPLSLNGKSIQKNLFTYVPEIVNDKLEFPIKVVFKVNWKKLFKKCGKKFWKLDQLGAEDNFFMITAQTR